MLRGTVIDRFQLNNDSVWWGGFRDRINSDARGWVAHHNTDIWGDCAPQDTLPSSTYWQIGAAWLCLHILEHFRYTNDRAFLAEYLPLVKEAALFFEDTLI